MTRRSRRDRLALADERGFTLLELIVAAGILALIAVFSWRGLDALIREREAIAASQATVDVLQRSFARIELDALLARDVELDGAGSMRLTAGPSSSDGTEAATVEYRVRDGALTRTVVDADRAPLTLLVGVVSVVMEAWAPAPPPRAGAWVRTKGAAPEAPPPKPAGAPAQGAPLATQAGAQAGAQQQAALPGMTPPATEGVAQPAQQAGAPPAPAVAAVAAATGVRLTIALSNGRQIVRSFVVGGA